jgi:polygalacturonase
LKQIYLISCFFFWAVACHSEVGAPRNLISPPGAQTDSSITLLWDKPVEYSSVTGYEVCQDGTRVGAPTRCNFQATNLSAARAYTFTVRAKSGTALSAPANTVTVSTRTKGAAFLVTNFGAIGDGSTDSTKALQAAIDACTANGTVVVPAGTFITGALFVRKSDISIFLSRGAVLKGTHDLAAYPLIKSRYEGYERESYASIINCGGMAGGVANVAIRGPGTIDCQGSYLSEAQTKARNRSEIGRAHV